MSCYILYKNNNIVNIEPSFGIENIYHIQPYISHSLFLYYYDLYKYIYHYKYGLSLTNSYNEKNEIYNMHLFTRITNISNLFTEITFQNNTSSYNILEVSRYILEHLPVSAIQILCISSVKEIYTDCLYKIRGENYANDNITYYEKINDNVMENISKSKYDFIYLEIDDTSYSGYINSFIESIMVLMKSQNKNGISILKISHIFYKPIVDLIYIICSLYEEVYISKPNKYNDVTFDKYIICKSFIINDLQIKHNKMNYYKFLVLLKKLGNKQIKSILPYDIPYNFKCKLNEINIIFGQSQLANFSHLLIKC
jgi:hypothetical protein